MELLISAGLILAIVLWGVAAPDSLGAVFDTALAAITRNFGWFYLWVVLGLVVMALILAFSRYPGYFTHVANGLRSGASRRGFERARPRCWPQPWV